MALIKCPECKKPISSTVYTCPHCGYVISPSEREAAIKDAELNPVSFESPQQNTVIVEKKVVEDEGSVGGGFTLGFLLGLVGLIIALCVGKKYTKSFAVVGFVLQAVIGVLIWIIVYCSTYGSYY